MESSNPKRLRRNPAPSNEPVTAPERWTRLSEQIITKYPGSARLKWDIRSRFSLVEAIALFHGRITSQMLMDKFEISRAQASKDFSLYGKVNPRSLIYDKIRKGYFASRDFRPKFLGGDASELLHLVEASGGFSDALLSGVAPWVEILQPPVRGLDIRMLRRIFHAIRGQRKLSVRYQSMSRGEPADHQLSPHACVFNGRRWHVRAYDEGHDDYRDFVLGRILGVPQDCGAAEMTVEKDLDWREYETLEFEINPAASAGQRAILAQEYGLSGDRLRIKVRRAMKTYLLAQLAAEIGELPPGLPPLRRINSDRGPP